MTKPLAALVLVALLGAGTTAHAQVELLFNAFAPPKHIINSGIVFPWTKDVERATEGRVRISIPPSSLAPPQSQYDMVTQKVADGAYIFNAWLEKRAPLIQMSMLPLQFTNAEANAVALWRTYKEHFEKADQFKGVVVLGMFSATGADICSLKEPIVSVESMRNRKIWSIPGIPAQALGLLGVTVVPGPAVRVFEIVSAGTVDGTSGLAVADMVRWKIDRYTRSCTLIPGKVFAATFTLFVHPDKWNQISARDREAIMSVSGEALARRSKVWELDDAVLEESFRKSAKPLIQASPAFHEQLKRGWQPLYDEWIAEAKKHAVDGRAALDFFAAQARSVTAERK